MYYGRVQSLPQTLFAFIRKQGLLKAGDRVGVAVSGGADSVALLRLFLDLRKQLGVVLSVVHFNHKLRGVESDTDERFVAELAQQHNLEFGCETSDVQAHAKREHLSLETAARRMRYGYFRRLLLEGPLNRIATAHTLDDQAETVLLRIARGAGSRGLAGIYPQLSVPSSQFSDGVSIIRPLLGTRRKDLEAYLQELGQPWREDSSNRDLRHTRNRVRHGILPRLERNLNPAVREALAETAEIARAEEEYWERQVASLLPTVWKGTLKVRALAALPLALQRRIVRAAAESLGLRLEFRHVEEILRLASNQPGSPKAAVLPDGWTVLRKKDELKIEPERPLAKPSDYEVRLPLPGAVEVPQLESRFEAVLVSQATAEVYNRDHLLNPALLGRELRVRNWRPGDRFWLPHTKAPKKLKELLQSRHLTGPEKKLWPVVVNGADVIWVRGFPAPSHLRAENGENQMVVIREVQMRS
jgi:tRNA(Ile)-lysidine synthase